VVGPLGEDYLVNPRSRIDVVVSERVQGLAMPLILPRGVIGISVVEGPPVRPLLI